MLDSEVSRRAFGRMLAASAAVAALPLPRATAAPVKRHEIRLSANENPFGPSQDALHAMSRATLEAARYPDALHDELTNDVAQLHEISSSEVLLGDGSSDLLRCAVAAFTGPEHPLVVADPTFEAPESHTRASGAKVIKVPLLPSFAHDVIGMRNASKESGLIYVCNPNNPTATITPKSALEQLIESAPATTTILVDEAYFHYVTSPDYATVVPLVRSHSNVIVTRTFSKIYGMAGARCGYAIGAKEAIAKLRAQQQWDAMNVVALAGARASLGEKGYVAATRKRNEETRGWLEAEVKKLGYTMLPSEANFVMIDVKREAKPMITAMRENGIHVGRPFPAMPKHMRVTIGTPEEMQAFVSALRRIG